MSDKKYKGFKLYINEELIGEISDYNPIKDTDTEHVFEIDLAQNRTNFLQGKIEMTLPLGKGEVLPVGDKEEDLIVTYKEVETHEQKIPLDIALNASQEIIHKDLNEIRIAKGKRKSNDEKEILE